MRRTSLVVILFLFSLFVNTHTALSQPASQVPPPLNMSDDLLQQKIKEISKTLRCAVCQSESVWESNATLAIQMRDIVRERLIEGQTADEIRAYFVSRYGDYIVFKPRFRGLNLLLWGGPFILLAIGGIILARNLQKWSARSVLATPSATTEAMAPISEKQRKRIEAELQSLK
ncbi:MAG: cytochrome c-type biogenesis protein CcmH [Nitrospiria bacterium]